MTWEIVQRGPTYNSEGAQLLLYQQKYSNPKGQVHSCTLVHLSGVGNEKHLMLKFHWKGSHMKLTNSAGVQTLQASLSF